MLAKKELLLEPTENSPYNARTVLYSGVIALQRAGISMASLDARILLQHVLGATREELLADDKRELTLEQYIDYQGLIEGRLKRRPVSQLIGKREFWGLTFQVTDDTLDPRPDSETLIEAVLSKIKDRDRELRILDLGTGTGCLLIALLTEYKNASGIGIDISEGALKVARSNAQMVGVNTRVDFMKSRWVSQLPIETFDIVISNPPYIATADIAGLEPEVRNHEPLMALCGGEDGLNAYREIIPQLPQLLAKDGLAVLEIGAGQEGDVQTIAAENGLRMTELRYDLGGIARCLLLSIKH